MMSSMGTPLLLLLLMLVATLQLCLQVQNVGASRFEGIPDEVIPTSSGYLTVNETTGATLFYIYYEAHNPEGPLQETPIVLWLQGGPGCSGMVGSFFELGPWLIGADQQFSANEYTWNRLYGLLVIDQPVGTGFSVAPSKDDVPTSDEQTAAQLYNALEAFYTRLCFETRPLYVTGESYAGKYVPAIGYYVLEGTAAGTITPSFQLKGVAIGNGLTDPILQIPVYPPAAHYMGLVDLQQKQELEVIAEEVVAAIEEGRYDLAHAGRSRLMNAIYQMSGVATTLDIRRPIDYYTYPNGSDWLSPVMNSPSFKKALGVHGNVIWEDCTDFVDEAFYNQSMRSTKYMVEAIVTQVPVLLYQGQFDLQDGVASNEAWMRNLNWTESEKFWSVPRKLWKLNGEIAAYVRTHETLAHVVVVGAGHLAPADQGLRVQKMLEAWIGGSIGSLGTDSGLLRAMDGPRKVKKI
ncbi:unnamed protein product [Calypogeia fissa]